MNISYGKNYVVSYTTQVHVIFFFANYYAYTVSHCDAKRICESNILMYDGLRNQRPSQYLNWVWIRRTGLSGEHGNWPDLSWGTGLEGGGCVIAHQRPGLSTSFQNDEFVIIWSKLLNNSSLVAINTSYLLINIGANVGSILFTILVQYESVNSIGQYLA